MTRESAPPITAAANDTGSGTAPAAGASTSSTASTASADVAALAQAERAFAVGDYRALRHLLPSLQAEGTHARVAQWVRAISVDPVQLAVLVSCALAFAAIAIRYGASR